MNAVKYDDLADFINEETDFFWDDIKDDLPEYPTEALIEIMVGLGLYVNKTIASEIAKRDDAVFYLKPAGGVRGIFHRAYQGVYK